MLRCACILATVGLLGARRQLQDLNEEGAQGPPKHDKPRTQIASGLLNQLNQDEEVDLDVNQHYNWPTHHGQLIGSLQNQNGFLTKRSEEEGEDSDTFLTQRQSSLLNSVPFDSFAPPTQSKYGIRTTLKQHKQVDSKGKSSQVNQRNLRKFDLREQNNIVTNLGQQEVNSESKSSQVKQASSHKFLRKQTSVVTNQQEADRGSSQTKIEKHATTAGLGKTPTGSGAQTQRVQRAEDLKRTLGYRVDSEGKILKGNIVVPQFNQSSGESRKHQSIVAKPGLDEARKPSAALQEQRDRNRMLGVRVVGGKMLKGNIEFPKFKGSVDAGLLLSNSELNLRKYLPANSRRSKVVEIIPGPQQLDKGQTGSGRAKSTIRPSGPDSQRSIHNKPPALVKPKLSGQ